MEWSRAKRTAGKIRISDLKRMIGMKTPITATITILVQSRNTNANIAKVSWRAINMGIEASSRAGTDNVDLNVAQREPRGAGVLARAADEYVLLR